MTFKLYRESGLPIILEPEEVHELKTLELQGRWTELEQRIQELKDTGDLTSMLVEGASISEMKLFLTTIDSESTFEINFENNSIAIKDGRKSNT
jgi:hypothetical protein